MDDPLKFVNPAHLFLADHAGNMADMLRKGRHRPGHNFGEKHGMHKLSEEQVRWILLHGKESTQRELARQFGVAQHTIGRILRRKGWKHV